MSLQLVQGANVVLTKHPDTGTLEIAVPSGGGGGGGGGAMVASRTLLAGLATAGGSALLIEAGREGLFVWDPANHASHVTADPRQGLYVAPTSDTTGASGAWVRRFSGPLNAAWFGAKGDGATDDTAALQAALNAITATSPVSRELHIRAGTYLVSNLTITQTSGITVRGEGRTTTIIRANANLPALSTNGLWYSRFEGLSFHTSNTLSNMGVVEQDGNYDGVHGQTTQAVTWDQCEFDGYGRTDGGRSTYAFTMCRQGTSNAQGSENLFLNCHFYSGTEACYYQAGFNALANTFIGGNFQSYPKYGIYAAAGTVAVFNTGFQSTFGYKQYANNGWDIYVGNNGVYEANVISGCRTESMRFLRSRGGSRTIVQGCVGVLSLTGWLANTAFGTTTAAGKAVFVYGGGSDPGRVYVATTEGTTGATQPIWPTNGLPITDGTVVWQELVFAFIDVQFGTVDFASCGMLAGRIRATAVNTLSGADFIPDPANGSVGGAPLPMLPENNILHNYQNRLTVTNSGSLAAGSVLTKTIIFPPSELRDSNGLTYAAGHLLVRTENGSQAAGVRARYWNNNSGAWQPWVNATDISRDRSYGIWSASFSGNFLTQIQVEITAPVDGPVVLINIEFYPSSSTDGLLLPSAFVRQGANFIEFGGGTPSHARLSHSGPTLRARLGDDSDYTAFDAAEFRVGGAKVLGAPVTGTPPAATDLASAITAVNFLRAVALTHGLSV